MRYGFTPFMLTLLALTSAPPLRAAVAGPGARIERETTRKPDVERQIEAGRTPEQRREESERLRRVLPRSPADLEPTAAERPKEAIRRAMQRSQPPSLPTQLEKPRDDPRRAEYVRWVQRSLNQVDSAGLSVDGAMSRPTRDAVRAFQQSRGLRVDGVVGLLTERELMLASRTHPPQSCESLLTSPLRRIETGPAAPPGELRPGHDPVLLKDAVHAVVTRTDNGELHVTASWGEMPSGAEAGEAIWHDGVRVDTPEQLLASARGRRLVFSGDPLPREWLEALRAAKASHVRASKRSPKPGIAAHVAAAEALERPFSRDRSRTRIFDALPRGRTEKDVLRELERLGLDPGEAELWRKNRAEIRAVEAESGYRVEVATRKALLKELRSGSADTIVLFAHSRHGNFPLTREEPITREELASLPRRPASSGRPRAIVFFSCEAGANTLGPSSVELLLFNGVGDAFIAPSTPVSATAVPGALRRFIIEGEPLRDAFPILDPPQTRRGDDGAARKGGSDS